MLQRSSLARSDPYVVAARNDRPRLVLERHSPDKRVRDGIGDDQQMRIRGRDERGVRDADHADGTSVEREPKLDMPRVSVDGGDRVVGEVEHDA
jgi:hypothetical protein